MRKELRRSLFAAAFAGAALAACGGGGGSPTSGRPVPAPPPPPPPPPPPVAASYFQAARAGITMPTNTIPFFQSPTQTSPFGLVWADPSNLPPAFAVTTGGQNQLETGGFGLDLAAVSEYTPSGGMATNWSIRYRVYADATNSAGVLYAVDLRKPTPLANPVTAQVSSGTVTSLALCPALPPVLFDNYSSANLSWIVFHATGTNAVGAQACGTLADTYVGVQPGMSSAMAPKSLGLLEPVQALYDASGTITGYLAINHTALDSTGNPTPPVLLQQLDVNFASPKTVATLVGKGSNTTGTGADFRSLGVSATTNVSLYFDNTSLNAVDASGVMTPIGGFTLATGATIQGGAVFDGAKAYVAFAGTGGSQIFQIDTAAKSVTATQTLDAAGAGGITLVGVTSNNLVYVIDNGSAIKSVVKSSLTATTPLATLSATQTIDTLMGPNGSAGPPPVAFLVGDTVYFTVADSAASGATGFAKQPFSVTFNASGVPGAATSIGTGVGAVLGVVAPASIPTSGQFTNAGALVLTGGANNGSMAGQTVFASGTPAVASSLGLYGAGGTLSTTIGAFTTTNPSTSSARVNPITGVALNGPAQAGVPATLETFGPDGVGGVGNDLVVFASDASIPLNEISGFLAHARRPR